MTKRKPRIETTLQQIYIDVARLAKKTGRPQTIEVLAPNVPLHGKTSEPAKVVMFVTAKGQVHFGGGYNPKTENFYNTIFQLLHDSAYLTDECELLQIALGEAKSELKQKDEFIENMGRQLVGAGEIAEKLKTADTRIIELQEKLKAAEAKLAEIVGDAAVFV